jgi:hypothetical protein
MKQFISDPGSIITIFGTSAPQTAIFFMTYIVRGCAGLPAPPLGVAAGCRTALWVL